MNTLIYEHKIDGTNLQAHVACEDEPVELANLCYQATVQGQTRIWQTVEDAVEDISTSSNPVKQLGDVSDFLLSVASELECKACEGSGVVLRHDPGERGIQPAFDYEAECGDCEGRGTVWTVGKQFRRPAKNSHTGGIAGPDGEGASKSGGKAGGGSDSLPAMPLTPAQTAVSAAMMLGGEFAEDVFPAIPTASGLDLTPSDSTRERSALDQIDPVPFAMDAPNNRPADGRVCDCEDAPCCGHYES